MEIDWVDGCIIKVEADCKKIIMKQGEIWYG